MSGKQADISEGAFDRHDNSTLVKEETDRLSSITSASSPLQHGTALRSAPAALRIVSTRTKHVSNITPTVPQKYNNHTSTNERTWASLFKATSQQPVLDLPPPQYLLNLPNEIKDMILDYARPKWAVTILQTPSSPDGERGHISVYPHRISDTPDESVDLCVAPCTSVDSKLVDQLTRFAYTPENFIGYTQIISMNLSALWNFRRSEVRLATAIAKFWPGKDVDDVLDWLLGETKVIQMSTTLWEHQPWGVKFARACPKIERVIIEGVPWSACTDLTARESRGELLAKVEEVDWSREAWAVRTRGLVKHGIGVTFRVPRVHRYYWAREAASALRECRQVSFEAVEISEEVLEIAENDESTEGNVEADDNMTGTNVDNEDDTDTKESAMSEELHTMVSPPNHNLGFVQSHWPFLFSRDAVKKYSNPAQVLTSLHSLAHP